MALGKPVVTTTIGAEGIEGNNGIHYLIADTPERFAENVLRLLNDSALRDSIGKEARELVRKKYTWSAVGTSLITEVENILQNAR